MNTSVRARHAERGFSMVELLVTVVLAGIIFAAMVPVFANALKQTSNDNFRVTATNIAQDRIEKIRTLDFIDITTGNLTDSSFADNEFGTAFVTISGKSYQVESIFVVDAPKYKTIKVKVTWGTAASDSTTVQTVVMDPTAETVGASPTPTAAPSPNSTTGTSYTLVVSVTDDDVDPTYGVRVVRIDNGYNQTQSPSPQVPNATNALSVSWSPLIGGPNVVYRVTLKCTPPGYSIRTMTKDVTLIDTTSVYFDTDPYH
jgi:prepilin-type N-terminal cleavage/methylation domain-containing protein